MAEAKASTEETVPNRTVEGVMAFLRTVEARETGKDARAAAQVTCGTGHAECWQDAESGTVAEDNAYRCTVCGLGRCGNCWSGTECVACDAAYCDDTCGFGRMVCCDDCGEDLCVACWEGQDGVCPDCEG